MKQQSLCSSQVVADLMCILGLRQCQGLVLDLPSASLALGLCVCS